MKDSGKLDRVFDRLEGLFNIAKSKPRGSARRDDFIAKYAHVCGNMEFRDSIRYWVEQEIEFNQLLRLVTNTFSYREVRFLVVLHESISEDIKEILQLSACHVPKGMIPFIYEFKKENKFSWKQLKPITSPENKNVSPEQFQAKAEILKKNLSGKVSKKHSYIDEFQKKGFNKGQATVLADLKVNDLDYSKIADISYTAQKMKVLAKVLTEGLDLEEFLNDALDQKTLNVLYKRRIEEKLAKDV